MARTQPLLDVEAGDLVGVDRQTVQVGSSGRGVTPKVLAAIVSRSFPAHVSR
jgi:hypothetical protein